MVSTAEALRSAALIVHFGGSGLAAEALIAGVPQLVLSMQIEQWLNGAALQNAGLGKTIEAFDPATRITSEIDDLLAATSITEAAANAGRLHRELLSRTDALATFESACRLLLAA
jgi:UDP:flavonoid glycosyltransferase YjiC (YdhE family)